MMSSTRTQRSAIAPTREMGRSILPKERLPKIYAPTQHFPTITPKAWQALKKANKEPYIFKRGGSLVRIELDENDSHQVKAMDAYRLRHEMARVAFWYTRNKDKKEVDAKPPVDVMKDMLASPDYPMPVLARITEVPIYGCDGSLLKKPGYHKESCTLFIPAKGFALRPASTNPRVQEIEEAKRLILEDLLVDFPFVADGDCANGIGLFLLPHVRSLIAGPTPNHLVEAPTPGSGKGLLVNVLLRPSVGSHLGMFAQANTNEEWRKRITACLRETREAVIIDNITEVLDSGELASALTSTEWEDRLLGKSEILTLPIRCVWVTAGNNVAMSTEIARRSVRIRLDPNVEKPWKREGFKHSNLGEWAKKHRSDLVWAAHTLINSWLRAGKPLFRERTLGSYERWAEIMGGVLENAGIDGFISNLGSLYEASDSENAMWLEFVSAWWDTHEGDAVGASDLIELTEDHPLPFMLSGSDHGRKVSFGSHLAKQRDRIFDKYRVVSAGTVQRAAMWRLQIIESESSESK